jgi:hypothetical protein
MVFFMVFDFFNNVVCLLLAPHHVYMDKAFVHERFSATSETGLFIESFCLELRPDLDALGSEFRLCNLDGFGKNGQSVTHTTLYGDDASNGHLVQIGARYQDAGIGGKTAVFV